MADLVGIYNQMVVALRAEEDSVTRGFFHDDFVCEEDPGMPYGGIFHGADGFIRLRHKVRSYWKIEILGKCAEPDGNTLVVVLGMTGHDDGPVAGMATVVSVIWTFCGDKAARAKVLYFNTPPLAAAIAGTPAVAIAQ